VLPHGLGTVPVWVIGVGIAVIWALWPRSSSASGSSGLLRLVVQLALALGAIYLFARWLVGV
jgi:hypothetical protein